MSDCKQRFLVEGVCMQDVHQWVDAESPEEAMQLAKARSDSWEVDMFDQYPAAVTQLEVTEEEEL